MDNTKKTIAVIDGNSWMHRAYHAVPPYIKMGDGTPTNAVHGFLNMFLSFMGKAQPDAVVCAFDAGIPQFRLEAVAQYKAQRKPMDNELRVQFPIIEDVLESLSIPVVKIDGWEGDDILGTIAAICEKQNMCSLLVTGDKDANQLASENTKIVNMKKGVSDVAVLGPAEVLEKYGVSVDQFIDYLALMGDSSDNIPGVPGIGPKSAQKLLEQFGDLEGIYSNLDKLKGKQRENIENNKDNAYISRKAATISTDVPLNLDLCSLTFPSFDADKVTETFLKYSLKGSLSAMLKIAGEEVPEVSSGHNPGAKDSNTNDLAPGQPRIYVESIPDFEYENYLTGKPAIKFCNELICSKNSFAVSVDKKLPMPPVQTSLFDVLEDESIEDDDFADVVMAVSDSKTTALLVGSEAKNPLVDFVKNSESCQLIVENAKPILSLLYPADSSIEPLISRKELYNADFFDLSLIAYLLNSSKDAYYATDIYAQIFGQQLPTIEAETEPSSRKKDQNYVRIKNSNLYLRLARRASLSAILKEPAKKLLVDARGKDVYQIIEKQLTPVLVEIERTGSNIDVERLSELSNFTAKEIEKLKSKIFEIAGEEFNLDSPKQLGQIMFEKLEMPVIKKTKTGYSTAADVLESLSNDYELPLCVLQYREYAKIKNTYIDALPSMRARDGLIHSTFHQRKTTTGRLSSSDPNIQNIPTRSEFGNKIRECFVPLKDGDVFVSADYSQIELRLLAHLSQDPGLIDAFNSGADFHAATAANIFNVDFSDVTRQQRSSAKAVNFGIVYGQQAFGLSRSLGIEMSEAQDIINRYFVTYPRVRKYLDDVVAKATELGYAESLFGRRRYIPELHMGGRFKSFGARTAMNHPMQGSAADIIKLAMIKVQQSIDKSGIDAKCMIQVHDELDFSCNKKQVDKLSELIKDIMENVVDLKVPLAVDVKWGESWAQAK